MNSSISNSDRRLPRVHHVLLLTAAICVAIALLRPPPRFASAPDWYWQMKIAWRHEAPIVLAGDSRVYRGLDPEVFHRRLGITCVNFGFSSCGFDASYLDAIERVVDARAPRAVIVLGLTPWSLTPQSLGKNGFTDALARERTVAFGFLWQQRMERFERAFAAVELETWWAGAVPASRAAARAKADAYQQEFHLNGWVPSDYAPRDVTRGLQIAAQGHADGNRVSPAVVRALLDRVRHWRQRGWIVLAYRPPTTPEAARLTDELSGFDQTAVATAMQSAGAIWVELDEGDYQTYDGSHLINDEARRLSDLLAARLHAELK